MTRLEAAEQLFLEPASLGRALGYADFRDEIHGHWIWQMVYGKGDMTLQAHRGSYKTTCLIVAIALLMVRERDKNIIFMRKTDTDVAEVIKGVARVLTHEVFQAAYTAISGRTLHLVRNTADEITTDVYCAPRGTAQLLGIGISGSLTGKHADIIITDDIVNLKDRTSHAEREHTKAVYQELQNVLNRGGRIINTGTPWHKDDCFVLMPPPEKWDWRRTGLIDEASLERLRRSMTPSLFAANYELKHVAAEDALFTEAPQYTSDETLLHDGISHIDAAYGGDDYTAFTCGRRDGDTLYLYGRLWHTHVSNVLPVIMEEADRLLCWPLYCESNGDKGFLKKEIRARDRFSKDYAEHENKTIKIATYLRKWWPSIVWLEGTDPEYIDQILDYTENAAHDDAPDSAACICRLLDRRSG